MEFKAVTTMRCFHGGQLLAEDVKVTWIVRDSVLEVAKEKGSLKPFVPPYLKLLEPLPTFDAQDDEDAQIVAVVNSLDAQDDNHWNKDGSVSLSAVNALLPFKIDRDRLDQVCPDVDRPLLT